MRRAAKTRATPSGLWARPPISASSVALLWTRSAKACEPYDISEAELSVVSREPRAAEPLSAREGDEGRVAASFVRGAPTVSLSTALSITPAACVDINSSVERSGPCGAPHLNHG